MHINPVCFFFLLSPWHTNAPDFKLISHACAKRSVRQSKLNRCTIDWVCCGLCNLDKVARKLPPELMNTGSADSVPSGVHNRKSTWNIFSASAWQTEWVILFKSIIWFYCELYKRHSELAPIIIIVSNNCFQLLDYPVLLIWNLMKQTEKMI